jgi:hypothetical protein
MFAAPNFPPGMQGGQLYDQIIIPLLELFNLLEHLPDSAAHPCSYTLGAVPAAVCYLSRAIAA